MGMSFVKSAVLIAGPTASGKSSLAMDVAHKVDGVIINADAMQVYADLRVLTSRPSEVDENSLPHRLYGTVPSEEVWSTGKWLDAVSSEIESVWRERKVPVVVGGTGLYFKALEIGLSPIPPVSEEVRTRWRDRLAAKGSLVLHAELASACVATAISTFTQVLQRLL